MTVCIAAICDDGKAIVVAADRMFTTPGISVEFETEEQKIEQLADNCVALSAGNSAYATEVLGAVRQHLNANRSPWIAEVAEAVRVEYTATRHKKIDETIVMAMLGADFSTFRQRGGTLATYLEKQQQMFQQITMMGNQYNLGVDIIVAGIDTETAHISQITHPGSLFNLEKLGYATIGSGAIHAMTKLTLGSQTRHTGLYDTVHIVYEAKRAAEAAPGVGNATDIAVIRAQDGLKRCDGPIIQALDDLHGKVASHEKPDLKPLREACNAQWPA
jgi:20S proteasome alpha/beta subunit